MYRNEKGVTCIFDASYSSYHHQTADAIFSPLTAANGITFLIVFRLFFFAKKFSSNGNECRQHQTVDILLSFPCIHNFTFTFTQTSIRWNIQNFMYECQHAKLLVLTFNCICGNNCAKNMLGYLYNCDDWFGVAIHHMQHWASLKWFLDLGIRPSSFHERCMTACCIIFMITFASALWCM